MKMLQPEIWYWQKTAPKDSSALWMLLYLLILSPKGESSPLLWNQLAIQVQEADFET